jgi:hypothetical protein
MAGMREQRVATTNMLFTIIEFENKYQFNRQHDPADLSEIVDTDGFHLLDIVVPYHRASFGPTREPVWPDHHRVLAYIKTPGTDVPITWQMDVADEVWNALPTVDMFMEIMEKAGMTNG